MGKSSLWELSIQAPVAAMMCGFSFFLGWRCAESEGTRKGRRDGRREGGRGGEGGREGRERSERRSKEESREERRKWTSPRAGGIDLLQSFDPWVGPDLRTHGGIAHRA